MNTKIAMGRCSSRAAELDLLVNVLFWKLENELMIDT